MSRSELCADISAQTILRVLHELITILTVINCVTLPLLLRSGGWNYYNNDGRTAHNHQLKKIETRLSEKSKKSSKSGVLPTDIKKCLKSIFRQRLTRSLDQSRR
jgi:hypothetical protein